MNRDYIEINKNLIPYEFSIVLADETFLIGVSYNNTAEMIVLKLSKLNEKTGEYEEVCSGEPLVYGKPLWEDVFINDKYPALVIIPVDESGESNVITFDNLNETVFLEIDNQEESIVVKDNGGTIMNSSNPDSYLTENEKLLKEVEEMIDNSNVIDN